MPAILSNKDFKAIKKSSEKNLDVYNEVEFNKILRRERARLIEEIIFFRSLFLISRL
jgi:hypothetical protein